MDNTPQKLDTKGMVCPMPAAETRKRLKTMQSGQVLEIEGDFDCAFENVINMAIKNGAEVLQKEARPNYFKIVVKKI